MRRLRDTLRARQGEVERLRKALRGRKLTPDQVCVESSGICMRKVFKSCTVSI